MASQDSLFESLEREFCPPLDTSLLAALISELESPTSAQIDDLRNTLQELCTHAQVELDQEDTLCDATADLELSSQSMTTDEICDFYSGGASTGFSGTPSSSGSNYSGSSHQSFSSPLGFLQAALPHIDVERLNKALNIHGVGEGYDGEEVDMEAIVESLLTDEYVRELEERGIDGIDEDEPFSSADDETPWEMVKSKKPANPTPDKSLKTIRKRDKGKTITLVDIRQRQHLPSIRSRSSSAPDPWTTLSSLSTLLSTLLSPHPASFFQSYFHSPAYRTPYDALCAALVFISSRNSHEQTEDQLDTFLEIIYSSPSCPTSPTQLARIASDAQLVLNASQGLGSEALDLVWLLHELNTDAESGLEMGMYHLPPASASTPTRHAKSRSPSPLPSGPPEAQLPRHLKPTLEPTPQRKHKPSPFEWQAVPSRKTHKGPHPLAAQIPAYDTHRKLGGKAGNGQMGSQTEKYWNSMRRRHELLREATKAWQSASKKNRGGEVALYFAERAREMQEIARKEALTSAKSMVEAKRLSSNDKSTVDLHGTTVSEAIAIIRDILRSSSPAPTLAKPLKIITGKGTHSTGRVGVLRPAVKTALVNDGWNVGVWEAGLVVRGKV